MKKRLKILLVTPPYHAGVVESAGRWMPLSYVYLAGAVRADGFEAEIYDAMTKQHTIHEIGERLKTTDADVIGISSITSSMPAALEVLRKAKQYKPQIKTILGGVHPTFCYDELLQQHADVIDFIVCGEGEQTLPALMNAIEKELPPDNVRGVAFIRNNTVVKTQHQPFACDLDSLPTAWNLIDWEDYRYFVIPGSRLAAISTSRGCTHGCTFCSQQKFWQKIWRARKPEHIVAEIEMLKKMYGANVFLIVDEYPTKDRERWEEFLDLLIQRQLGVYLLMETRVEDIVRDRDILWKYRTAGIVHIYIGVEATNQDTLDIVKKDINVEQSKEAIRLIHEHRMISETSFVLGFPWETEKSIEQTLELAHHYNPDFAHFLAITPWPYADIYAQVKDSIAEWDYSKYNLVEPVIRPSAMSLEDIRSAIVDCYRRYYMRKAPEYFQESDTFRREYLKRSMHLIMKNSFLTKFITNNTTGHTLADMHKMFASSKESERKAHNAIEAHGDFFRLSARAASKQ